MTKELVKGENGNKIIKHARLDRTHSLSSGSWIKMRFSTPWLVLLFLAVVSGDSASSSTHQQSVPRVKPERTTEDGQMKSTDSSVSTNNSMLTSIWIENLRNNDDNDLAPDKDMTMEELLLIESLIDEDDKITEENNQKNSGANRDVKSDDVENPENPVESKISPDLIDIRRQGEVNQGINLGKSSPDVQFDDSKQEVVSDIPPRFGQRSRKSKQKVQDEAPLLQLTQGGYTKPFKRPRFRNRYASRPESSEQSSNVQEPDRVSNNNRQPDKRRIVPEVTYSPSPQPPFAFGPGPILNPGFGAPARNMLAINHVVPTVAQNGFLNTPSAGFRDYTATAFQAQFPQNNDVGGFPNFGRDRNNAALYQASQRNPFQTPRILFQTAPQVQATQPVLIDPTRNVQPHFQTNPFTSYTGFENEEDSLRPNYAMYSRNPTVNTPFQVPPDFYGNAPNGVNPFNNPPITFLSNYPNSDDRLSSQFFRYPVTTDAQNNQQNNHQQLDSDASQEEKKAKAEMQEAGNPANRDDSPSVPFGTRLQGQDEGDVYMRYPTNEAGYAIEENLPPKNNSEESKSNGQQTSSEERNFPSADPYRNVLTSVRSNQRINNSFDFPPKLFGDVPINFGYQRPPSEIFSGYPDRNRDISHYSNPNFESRGSFDPIPSLPENNYQFLNGNNQRRGHRESDGTPSCAKQANGSICFEDNEYPGNDIVYSLNSNSFLADRLSGPELPLNSIVFVERNASETDQNAENYACAVDTRYGAPLRAKNLAGVWKIIVNLRGKISQPVRMEVCKSLGDPCSYADSRIKTTCVQKYSLQRLLTWSPGRGIYSDVYKIPVACSCQIIQIVQA